MGAGFANARLGIAIAAGTGSAITGTVAMSNANSVTWGASASASSIVITASASWVPVTAGIQSISAGTTQATTGQVVFSNSNGILFGGGGSLVDVSVPNAILRQGRHSSFNASLPIASTTLNCVLSRMSMLNGLTATRAVFGIYMTASNTTGSYSISMGVYTLSRSTASLVSSASFSVSWSSGGASTNLAGYVGQSGLRYVPIILSSWALPASEYLFAFIGSLSASNGSWTWMGLSRPISLPGGATPPPYFEVGAMYSAGTGALPTSIRIADQVQSVLAAPPAVSLLGTF